MPIATLADIVRHHRTAHAESIALSFEGHDTSYALLDRRANQVSNGLACMGVRAGARVALLDKNNGSFFEIWFGATKANVVLVPINDQTTSRGEARMIPSRNRGPSLRRSPQQTGR